VPEIGKGGGLWEEFVEVVRRHFKRNTMGRAWAEGFVAEKKVGLAEKNLAMNDKKPAEGLVRKGDDAQ